MAAEEKKWISARIPVSQVETIERIAKREGSKKARVTCPGKPSPEMG